MQQFNIDPYDAERMDDLEEECERYQILHIFQFVVMLVILVHPSPKLFFHFCRDPSEQFTLPFLLGFQEHHLMKSKKICWGLFEKLLVT